MDGEVFTQMLEIEDRHWWYRARRRIVRALVGRLAGPAGEGLEIGCGGGGNVAMLAEFGPMSAVEMDPVGRAAAVKRGIAVTDGWLPDGLPFPPERQFARVALLDVLEHVPDDAAGLRRIRDLLQPDGQVVITVPAHQWLWRKQDELNHHFRRYTRRSLRRVVEAAGLEVRYAGYYNVTLFPLIVGIILGNKWLGRVQNDDNRIPAGWINGALEAVMALERHVLPWLPSPMGASVILIASRPGHG